MKRAFFLPLLSVITGLLIALVIVEAILRMLGEKPFREEVLRIHFSPKEKIFERDSLLGFKLASGEYTLIYDNGFKWSFKTGENGYRISTLQDYSPDEVKKKVCWILGCSYTFGWSVNDSETYPYLLQKDLSSWTIRNLGQPAYSTLQSLLQFQKELKHQAAPNKLILAYAAFHDERNAGSANWFNQLAPYNKLGELSIPVAAFKNDSLTIITRKVKTSHCFLSRYLVFMHFLEKNYRSISTYEKSRIVTIEIIKKLEKICNDYGIELNIVITNSNKRTTDFISTLDNLGITTYALTIDTRLQDNTNLPYDSHPGKKAHQELAEKMKKFIFE